MTTDDRDGGGGSDRLRELARSGEPFVAVGQDGDDHVVIAVGAPAERAEAIASATGVRVGRVDDGEMERLVLAFFAERDTDLDQEPAFALALAPAVPEQRSHLAALARAERASLVVLEVPGGDRRGIREIAEAALDELRELTRDAGIEGA